MSAPTPTWTPTAFRLLLRSLPSSMRTVEIITDAGGAYLKAMGTTQGSHPLACDLIGTQVAKWLGLPTFEFSILNVKPDDEIWLHERGRASPGPAFATRSMDGDKWTGDPAQLDQLANPEAITWLVVLDTWLRAWDRYPPDGMEFHSPKEENVFLAVDGAPPSQFRLIAMDFSHCLYTCFEELTTEMADNRRVRDPALYGLFPAFRDRLRSDELAVARSRLLMASESEMAPFVQKIPLEWEVGVATRTSIVSFLVNRARFVAGECIDRLIEGF